MFNSPARLVRPGYRIEWDRYGSSANERAGSGRVLAVRTDTVAVLTPAGEDRIIPNKITVRVTG